MTVLDFDFDPPFDPQDREVGTPLFERRAEPQVPTPPSDQLPADTSPLRPPIPHPRSVYPDLIDQIIPAGSINILSGGSGVGKTALIAEWAARFRDGRQICWKPTRVPTGGIGVICGDRKWQSHRQWFEAVGFGDIPHYSLRDDTTFHWDNLLNRATLPDTFKRAADQLKLGRDSLIIVDPISLFIHGNQIDYKQTAIGLAKLDKMCTQIGTTLLGIAHTAKQKSDKKDRYVRPQDRILGSGAFAGFSDTVMYLIGPEELDAEYYGFGWIPHHTPPETFSFTRSETGLFVPYDHPNKDADLQHVYSVITEDPDGTATKEIVDACMNHLDVAKTTLYNYLNLLLSQGKIEKVGRGKWKRATTPATTPIPSPDNPPIQHLR